MSGETSEDHVGSEQERRRDEALRRALAMPPKKHATRAPDVSAELDEVRRRFRVARARSAALAQALSVGEDRPARS
jgi:hypothetical protein